jgi:hypothetical protein
MASTYEKVQSTTLSSTQSSITFSSISGAYTDLVLVMNPISNTTSGSYAYLRFNSDSTTTYSRVMMGGTGTAAQSDKSNNSSEGYFIYGNQVTTNASFNAIIDINNYSDTTTYKTFLSRTNTTNDWGVEALLGLWRSNSAITSITIYCGSNSFVSGSTFTLYGILAA